MQRMTPNASPFSAGPITPTLPGLLASARRQFKDGFNTFTLQGWQLYGLERSFFPSMTALKTNPELLAEYNAQFGTNEVEIPVTLQWSFGSYPNAKLFRDPGLRSDSPILAENDSADYDYLGVYHTCVQDILDDNPGKTLRDLIGLPAGTFANAQPAWLQCPSYRGKHFQDALAQLEEHVRWLLPIMVSLDIERWMPSALAAQAAHDLLHLDCDQYESLSLCARCLTREGYERGKDDFISTIIKRIRAWVPLCIITNFNSYSAKASFTTEKYGGGNCFNFGDCSASGWSWENSGWSWENLQTGAPNLYGLSYAASRQTSPADALEIRQAMLLARNSGSPANEAGDYFTDHETPTWPVQPEALKGSYPWVTFYTNADVDDCMTDAEWYDFCYALGLNGVVGLNIFPGYSTSGTNTPDNLNLKRLLPIGLKALEDAKMENLVTDLLLSDMTKLLDDCKALTVAQEVATAAEEALQAARDATGNASVASIEANGQVAALVKTITEERDALIAKLQTIPT